MSGGCKDCKRVREHVASLLPFRVLEAVAGKPLRISGVALSAGVSRNFNVYTAEELQAFASELVNSPMYIEHVAVSNAVGKVTKAFYDSVSRCLMYEAEVYDQALADKIRNGLVQHVSVGADYDTLDTVNANVPHGLHNAELSLVAVPGIPEANIHVLEHLAKVLKPKRVAEGAKSPVLKVGLKELLAQLGPGSFDCVFCGQPGTFLVSTCEACGDKAAASQVLNALSRIKFSEAYLPSSPDYTTFKVRFQALGDNPCEICKALDGKEFVYGTQPELPIHENCKCGYDIVERLHVRREQLEPQMPGEYFLGFYQDVALFLSEHFRIIWLDQANGVLAVMAKTRADPALERCQAILFLKVKWQPNTVADWLAIHPDYQVPANGSAGQAVQSGVEKLEEKDIEKIAEKVLEKMHFKEQSDADKQAQIERSQKYGIGIKKGGNVTKPSEFASIADDLFADPVNFKYPVDKDHVQAALSYFNVPENRADYSPEEQVKILSKIVQSALAAGVEVKYQANDGAYKALPEELKAKCQGYTKEPSAAEKLVAKEAELTVAKQTVEKLKRLVPGVDLLVDPPVLMLVSEHIAVLETLLPPVVVERSSLGMQRQGQAVRAAILKAKEKLQVG